MDRVHPAHCFAGSDAGQDSTSLHLQFGNLAKASLCQSGRIKKMGFEDWAISSQETAAGSMATVTGWGTLSEGALGLPNVLHKVTFGNVMIVRYDPVSVRTTLSLVRWMCLL